jgi:flagellar protein FliO/FliZ
MMKTITLSRAAAQAAAALAACVLALACPGAALAAATTTTGTTTTGTTTQTTTGSGENTPLNLSPSSTAPHTSSGGASIVRTIVGLAIVIAVIWGLSWILRQVKAGRDPQAPSEGLASVAALTLGGGRSVHLVRAGNDYVLLGSAEQGLVPIHRYTHEQAREAGLPMLDESPPRPRRALLAQRTPAGEAGLRRARTTPLHRAGEAPLHRAGEYEGRRPDPMRMPSPSSGLIERLREWTVRR